MFEYHDDTEEVVSLKGKNDYVLEGVTLAFGHEKLVSNIFKFSRKDDGILY